MGICTVLTGEELTTGEVNKLVYFCEIKHFSYGICQDSFAWQIAMASKDSDPQRSAISQLFIQLNVLTRIYNFYILCSTAKACLTIHTPCCSFSSFSTSLFRSRMMAASSENTYKRLMLEYIKMQLSNTNIHCFIIFIQCIIDLS